MPNLRCRQDTASRPLPFFSLRTVRRMMAVAAMGGSLCLAGCGGSNPNRGAATSAAPGGLSAPNGAQPGQPAGATLKPKKNQLGGEEP